MTRYQSSWRWRVLLAVLMLALLSLFAALMTSCASVGPGPQRVASNGRLGQPSLPIDWTLPVEVVTYANSNLR